MREVKEIFMHWGGGKGPEVKDQILLQNDLF